MNEKMFYDVLLSMARSLKSMEMSLRYIRKNTSRELEQYMRESRKNHKDNSEFLTESKTQKK